MWAVFSKEITSFYSSLVAYISVGIFLLILALFLWVFPDTAIPDYGYASLNTFFSICPFVFIFLVPALTMNSIAEEKKGGTLELLLCLPLREWEIIIAKFLACLTVIMLALIPTLVWYLSVYQLGNPVGNVDSGAVAGSYIGLLMLSMALVGIGVFCSSLTSNQILAFVIAVALSFFFFMGFDYISSIPLFSGIGYLISNCGLNAHYLSMSRGVLDTRDLIYFISLTCLFLLLTKLVLGSRKW